MKKTTLLFLFLLAGKLFGQNPISSQVFDENRLPIADVHIYSINEQITLSDSEGRFQISLKPNDTLFISHIGYEILTYTARQLPKKIFLVRKNYMLPELTVKVSRNRKKNKRLGFFWRKKSN